jgi:hypothetical protein
MCLFILAFVCLISSQLRANDLNSFLSKQTVQIQDKVKKLKVMEGIASLTSSYEMKCDDIFCRQWSKVSDCPSCCVRKCISSSCPEGKCASGGVRLADCGGPGWCSQPNAKPIKYSKINVFELLPQLRATAYNSKRKITDRLVNFPYTLNFEDRNEIYIVNPIDQNNYEVIASSGKKQIHTPKILEQPKIDSLVLRGGIEYDFKKKVLSYKGISCPPQGAPLELIKQSNKEDLCVGNGKNNDIYGIIILGSELIPLSESGIDFCGSSRFGYADLIPAGCW